MKELPINYKIPCDKENCCIEGKWCQEYEKDNFIYACPDHAKHLFVEPVEETRIFRV